MSALGELAGWRLWVAWRNEPRPGGSGKPAKVPYMSEGIRAKADDPATWLPRTEAEVVAQRIGNGGGGGVGIELGDLGDGRYLGGLDLDSCLSPSPAGDGMPFVLTQAMQERLCELGHSAAEFRQMTPADAQAILMPYGVLAPWAAAILEACPSYAEVSPSGFGLKLFFYIQSEHVRPFLTQISVPDGAWGCRRGVPGEDGRDHGPAVEIYLARRYFAVTDQHYAAAPDQVAVLDRAALERLAAVIPPARADARAWNEEEASGGPSRGGGPGGWVRTAREPSQMRNGP